MAAGHEFAAALHARFLAGVNTLVAWADSGSVEGDLKDAPAPLSFSDGWNIKPDIVVEMPKPFVLPAAGTINYKYILVKTDFPRDMWIQAAEMRLGNPKVLHHGKGWVLPPGSDWMRDAVPGEAYETETQRESMGTTTWRMASSLRRPVSRAIWSSFACTSGVNTHPYLVAYENSLGHLNVGEAVFFRPYYRQQRERFDHRNGLPRRQF